MKTIATAAVLMMLTVPAWADEPQSNEPANSNEPIVLSEAEMDGVTAGGSYFLHKDLQGTNFISSDDASTATTIYTGKVLFLPVLN